MKVARSSAIAGAGGTSNVAAAMRYGCARADDGALVRDVVRARGGRLPRLPRGLLAQHGAAGRHLRLGAGSPNAIAAARDTGIALRGVRLDSATARAVARGAATARRGGDGGTSSSRRETFRSTGSPSWSRPARRSTCGGGDRARDQPRLSGGQRRLQARRRPRRRWGWRRWRTFDKRPTRGRSRCTAPTRARPAGDVIAAEDEAPGASRCSSRRCAEARSARRR